MQSRSGSPRLLRRFRPATTSASSATRRTSSSASIESVEEHLVFGSILAAAVVLRIPMELAIHADRRDCDPNFDHRHVRLDLVQGFTLNSMTMLALTLAVGIVIDDAIVVLENIYRFIEEKGRTPVRRPRSRRRSEIGLAVLATTLSLVAIFVPVGFMGGIVGRFMTSFGFTMAFAILVSLLVSFTLTPMLAARWIKMRPRRDDAAAHEQARRRTRGSSIRSIAFYTAMLQWSLATAGRRRRGGARAV